MTSESYKNTYYNMNFRYSFIKLANVMGICVTNKLSTLDAQLCECFRIVVLWGAVSFRRSRTSRSLCKHAWRNFFSALFLLRKKWSNLFSWKFEFALSKWRLLRMTFLRTTAELSGKFLYNSPLKRRHETSTDFASQDKVVQQGGLLKWNDQLKKAIPCPELKV